MWWRQVFFVFCQEIPEVSQYPSYKAQESPHSLIHARTHSLTHSLTQVLTHSVLCGKDIEKHQEFRDKKRKPPRVA